MSSRFKLEVKLKQHTPIIHFQYKQAGAILRVTELKPALDNWIHKAYDGETVPKNWLLPQANGSSQLPLDYKLSVIPTSARVEAWPAANTPMYLGEMDKVVPPEKRKKLIIYQDIVKLSFFIRNENLREFLAKNIHQFFEQKNFGTRQNKGYGSFSKVNDDGDLVRPEEKYRYIEFTLDRRNREDVQADCKDIFTVIQYYYQRLKSGINYYMSPENNDYQESYLKVYFNGLQNGQVIWEKPWVKGRMARVPNVSWKENDHVFARAMLGLPYFFNFMTEPGRGTSAPKHKRNYPSSPREIKVTDENGTDKVDRIKSPLTFKPILFGDVVRIYIVPNTDFSFPANHRFTFTDTNDDNIRDTLVTPAEMINLNNLIESYHAELGRTFEARDYTGKFTKQVFVH